MAPDEGPNGTTRRVRSTRSTSRAGKRTGGGDLIEQLNEMVAELIKENRKLKREVDKLTERGSAAASSAVERSLRTIQRRVQRALTAPVKRGRRKAGATARGKKTIRKRRNP